jgi:hypothetical protein
VSCSDAPFEGKTVAQASFAGGRADPVRPVSRDNAPLASQKFLGVTEFQKAYPRHEVRTGCGAAMCVGAIVTTSGGCCAAAEA